MRTSTFEAQTQRDGPSRANNHSCFDFFFHDSGFHSQVKVL